MRIAQGFDKISGMLIPGLVVLLEVLNGLRVHLPFRILDGPPVTPQHLPVLSTTEHYIRF